MKIRGKEDLRGVSTAPPAILSHAMTDLGRFPASTKSTALRNDPSASIRYYRRRSFQSYRSRTRGLKSSISFGAYLAKVSTKIASYVRRPCNRFGDGRPAASSEANRPSRSSGRTCRRPARLSAPIESSRIKSLRKGECLDKGNRHDILSPKMP